MPLPMYLSSKGITDLLHFFLCLLSRGISLCLLVFPFCLDLFCDGQAFLPTYFLRHSRCLVAHKGGIIDFSIQTDAVGDDVNVSVVGVLVRYCYPLVVVKSPFRLANKWAIRISSDTGSFLSSCGAIPISMRRNLFLQRLLYSLTTFISS